MIHTFHELEWDEGLFELRYRGEQVVAQPRVLETIAHLIRNRSRAVSKDELVEVVWKGAAVSDAALSHTIMLARKAVRDEGKRQEIIRTVRGRGFRFVASVQERPPTPARVPAQLPVREAATGLVGRESELSALLDRLEHAERGRGSLVLVEGEPGIGKTCLAEQFASRAQARGANVFWARSWEEGGAPGFWLWIQVLRGIHARFGTDGRDAWFGAEQSELAALMRGEKLGGAESSPVSLELESSRRRFRLFDSMACLLRRIALDSGAAASKRRPLVVILEDLHAADEPSVQMLRFLAHELGAAPLLLVGTFRDLELPASSSLSWLLGGPLENSSRLPLQGLSKAEVGQLLERRFGCAVAARVARAVHELSGGNPFFVSELSRLPEAKQPDDLLKLTALAGLHVPERIAKAVGRSLEQLPKRTVELLTVASAMGREFSVPLLSELCSCSSEQLLDELEPASKLRLLEPIPGQAALGLRFSHSLVRDTLYGDLSAARRLELHRRIGEVLEARGDAERLHEIAHHFFLGATPQFADKASAYVLRAAQRAGDQMAYETSGTLYDRGIALVELGSKAQPALFGLLLSAGTAWYRAGQLETAVERFARAAHLAKLMSEPELFGWAALAYAQVRRGWLLLDERVLGLLREAVAGLPPGDSALKALLLCTRTVSFGSVGPLGERMQKTAEGVLMARRIGSDTALMGCLVWQLGMLTGATSPTETRDIATELMTLAHRTGHQDAWLEGLLWRIPDQLRLGDVEAFKRDLAEYKAHAQTQQHPTHLYWAMALDVLRAAWTGDFRDAENLCERAFNWGQRIQEPLSASVRAFQLWWLYSEQGKRVADPLIDSFSHADTHSAKTSLLIMNLEQGNESDARHLLRQLAADEFESIPHDTFRLTTLSVLSLASAELGDGRCAALLYDLLLPYAGLFVVAQHACICLGPVARFLGLLASCLGQHTLIDQHFQSAIEQCTLTGAEPRLAQIQYEYARALLNSNVESRRRSGSELLSLAEQGAIKFDLYPLSRNTQALRRPAPIARVR
jgi:eukaryotic-like serine/threonine-protein kinase